MIYVDSQLYIHRDFRESILLNLLNCIPSGRQNTDHRAQHSWVDNEMPIEVQREIEKVDIAFELVTYHSIPETLRNDTRSPSKRKWSGSHHRQHIDNTISMQSTTKCQPDQNREKWRELQPLRLELNHL